MNESADLPRAGRSRITAASFRSLTARLKRQAWVEEEHPEREVVWPEIPDLFVPENRVAEDFAELARFELASVNSPGLASEAGNDEPVAAISLGAPALEPAAPSQWDVPPPEWIDENALDAGPDVEIPTFVAPSQAEDLASSHVDEAAPEQLEQALATDMVDEVSEPDGIDMVPELAAAEAAEVPATWSVEDAVEPEADREIIETAIEAKQAASIEQAAAAQSDEHLDLQLDEAAVSSAAAASAEDISEADVLESAAPVVGFAQQEPARPDAGAIERTPEPDAPAAGVVAGDAVEMPVPPPATPGPGDDPGVSRETDVVMKILAKAIFAKPTQAERAAYLRDVAAMIAAEQQSAEAPGGTAVDPAPQADADLPTAPQPVAQLASLTSTLVDRLGPHQMLLRRAESALDPFAKANRDAMRPAAERLPGDEEAGAHALSLLDMMTSTVGAAQPQERALAADTLLHLIPRVPAKQLLSIVERLTIMETPPPLVVAKLIRDPRAEIVAPLVERCMAISDQDLITATAEGDVAKRRIIARRRHVSTVLSDTLIATKDPSVLLTLIRNPGASFSHEAFYVLADRAATNQSLLAPLATRNDLPAPVAFELFWHLPPELRRFVLSRFLTDSETLNRILKITRAAGDSAEAKFPSRNVMEQLIDTAFRGQVEAAAKIMAEAGAIGFETAFRILSDREGEPLAVALKALGLQRSKLGDALASLRSPQAGILRPDRITAELESIFDTLSFNKARILLTYWDWFVLKKGPYAPHH